MISAMETTTVPARKVAAGDRIMIKGHGPFEVRKVVWFGLTVTLDIGSSVQWFDSDAEIVMAP